MDAREFREGEELAALTKEPITKVQLLRYAGASGDDNLIHVDSDTARAVGLDGVIAHGMLSMGFLGQYVSSLAGPAAVRRLRVRFSGMVRPGDVLTCRGVVKETRDGIARLEVWAENQRGERVTRGDADLLSRA